MWLGHESINVHAPCLLLLFERTVDFDLILFIHGANDDGFARAIATITLIQHHITFYRPRRWIIVNS